MKKYKMACLSLALIASNGFAQEDGIRLGKFALVPSLDYDISYDDNVISDNDSQIESLISTLSPQLILMTGSSTNVFQVGYRGTRGDYFQSEEDNYTDHLVFADVDYEINSKNRFSFGVSWEDGHDNRGTWYTMGNGASLQEPDSLKNTGFDFLYSYGAATSKGQLDLEVDVVNIDYDINTDTYRARDRSETSINSTFYYSVPGASRLTVDLRHQIIDYAFVPEGNNSLSSNETGLFVGVEWDSTAKTSGFFKLGYSNKEFESPERDAFSGFDWQVKVLWEPRSYSRFEITTRSDTNETNGEGSFIRSKAANVTWRHGWIARLVSRVSLGYTDVSYEDSSGIEVRADTTQQVTTGLNYEFRRWASVDLYYSYAQRTSTRDGIDYDKNKVGLSFAFTL